MRIHPLDLAIVIAYLLAVTALGMRFRRSKKEVAKATANPSASTIFSAAEQPRGGR